MKRRKQLLSLIVAFVLVLASMPEVDLFAKVYDICGCIPLRIILMEKHHILNQQRLKLEIR